MVFAIEHYTVDIEKQMILKRRADFPGQNRLDIYAVAGDRMNWRPGYEVKLPRIN